MMDFKSIEFAMNALHLESAEKLNLIDAKSLRRAHVPNFGPDTHTLLLAPADVDSGSLKKILSQVYPPEFLVKTIALDGRISEIQLSDLDGETGLAIFIPAMGNAFSFEAFHEIIAHLRAPEDGCPWDKEQTHLSLRKHLLEESYETLSALDEQDPAKMCEEFGDLLLQIFLNAQIASEAGEFNMAAVLHGIHTKIVRRHPHVFGEVAVDGVRDVLSNWEKIKAGERKNQGIQDKGALDGLPAALPALIQAQEFQDRARRVGFDWPEIEGVLEKIQEEILEVQQTTNVEELTDELGDLFFALVNLARWKKIDAEAALRGASLKFKKRFKYVEKRANELGRQMQTMSPDELDGYWNEAKRDLASGNAD